MAILGSFAFQLELMRTSGDRRAGSFLKDSTNPFMIVDPYHYFPLGAPPNFFHHNTATLWSQLPEHKLDWQTISKPQQRRGQELPRKINRANSPRPRGAYEE